mgnify:CR=1 FL=1
MLEKSAIRHTIASASTAVFETLLFVLLVWATTVSPTIVNPATIFIGTALNFVLNKYWVFQSSSRAWHLEVGHFFVVAGFALIAQSLFFGALFHMFHQAVTAKLIALGLGFMINYPLKRWVFHQ